MTGGETGIEKVTRGKQWVAVQNISRGTLELLISQRIELAGLHREADPGFATSILPFQHQHRQHHNLQMKSPTTIITSGLFQAGFTLAAFLPTLAAQSQVRPWFH